MKSVEYIVFQQTESRVTTCAKCSEEITLKDTVFLLCKHAVHYDHLKKCPSYPSAKDLEFFTVELASSTTQKKRFSDLSEKSSNKKAKETGGKKVSC